MKQLLDFDDAGASDEEPAKGVTVGDIRAWHDQYVNILFSWAECRELLSAERARTARVQALLDVQKYENDVLSVGQIRRAMTGRADASCNHWPGSKRCEVCGMDNTSTLSSQMDK